MKFTIFIIVIILLLLGAIPLTLLFVFGNGMPNQVIISSPGKTTAITFGTPITLTPKQSTTFTNGLTVTLQSIADSRCKQGMVCVWAGELSGTFVLSGQNTPPQTEFTLGQVTGKSITLGNYQFTLNNITETSATLLVEEKAPTLGACYVGGCSGQLCTDQPNALSTCEARPEYACYKTAECARQANGQCGWTQTAELAACLANAK